MGTNGKTIKRPVRAQFIGLAAPLRERTRWVKYKCRANERKVELAPTMPNAADIQRSLSCVNLVAALLTHYPSFPKLNISDFSKRFQKLNPLPFHFSVFSSLFPFSSQVVTMMSLPVRGRA